MTIGVSSSFFGSVSAAALLAASVASSAGSADATTYYFGVSPQRTNISFESRAELETIIGSTMSLSGDVKVDEKKGTIEVDLTVPVKDLKTGVPLRDEHLQSDAWLDAAKYPDVTFKSTKGARKEKETDVWLVDGDFTMHGKKHALSVEVKTKKIPPEIVKKTKMEGGDWVRFSTSFKVKLSDHDVKIPDFVGPKVENEWTVKFEAFASTVPPEKKG